MQGMCPDQTDHSVVSICNKATHNAIRMIMELGCKMLMDTNFS